MTIFLLLWIVLLQSVAPTPGAALRPGMMLLYTNNGQSQPPWMVEAVGPAAISRPGAACIHVRIRRDPGQTPPDLQVCIDRGVLYQWSASRGEWVAQRPVAPRNTLNFPGADGSLVRYDTAETNDVFIGGRMIAVVETTVTTLDAAGNAVRRLREQFAPALTTAVAGRFEVPDGASPSGWRTEQMFELQQIVETMVNP